MINQKTKYKYLRSLGYNVKEATTLKKLKPEQLLKEKKVKSDKSSYKKELQKQIPKKPRKPRIKEEKTSKGYLQKYNYVIFYEVGRKNKNKWVDREERHLTIPSNHRLTKTQYLDAFWDWYDGENLEHYDPKVVIKSTIKLTNIYIKD